MRSRMLLSTLLLVFAVTFTAVPAAAQSPHFLDNTLSCTYSSNGGSTVLFDATGTVAGLGNATDWVTLQGSADIICTSSGKNGTQTTSAHHFAGSSPVFSTSNGNYPFDTKATVSCPGNQTATLSGTVQAELVLSSGKDATGTVFDTEPVTCNPQ